MANQRSRTAARVADFQPTKARPATPTELEIAQAAIEERIPGQVTIHEHGELGPILGDPEHDFTGPQDLDSQTGKDGRNGR